MGVVGSGKRYKDFLALIPRLPQINPIMPPFEGTEEQKDALAHYLEELVTGGGQKEEAQ
jgi:hypothetical protein